jgi:4-alpha-glucanotransferase
MDNTDWYHTDLYRLARLYNVQTAYYGVERRRRAAAPESLLAVLRALGAPLASFRDVPAALRERRLALRQRLLEPVNVVTDGRKGEIRLCLPAALEETGGEGRLEMEDGEVAEWQWRTGDLPTFQGVEQEGGRYLIKSLPLPARLPSGYHRLFLRAGKRLYEGLVISAPAETFQPPGEDERRWGAFLPLYALRTEEGWGGGDYTALGRLAGQVAGLGGSILGTLPLLPVFLDEPFEPSPYAPVSRRLWNEFYVDVTRAPGFEDCAPARALTQSVEFREEIAGLKAAPLVDYRRLMALKRRVMEAMCRYLTEARAMELERFARQYPAAGEYASFRAVMEGRQAPWPDWPTRLRDGILRPGDYDEDVSRYHLYAQWLANSQVGELAGRCREKGVRLYFDLPLGVHPYGYDVWRHQDIFALEASGGAPPDSVYTRGQDWGFPPLHPERIRAQGYRYVIDYLDHQLRFADMLRIDHMMGLHRLFWVPRGIEATHGVYVRYRADELYAILALESHRHRCVIIGEDLGTVPAYVRPAMARHGVRRMYILQYALVDSTSPALGHIPAGALAALNTHDMPPFAAFWQDEDIPQRLEMGLLDKKGAANEKRSRRPIKKALMKYLRRSKFLSAGSSVTRDVIRACLAYLGASPAGVVLVNLEDLWLETEPQNVPSVGQGYPSWRRRARRSLEEMLRMKEAVGMLEEVDRLRKRGKAK